MRKLILTLATVCVAMSFTSGTYARDIDRAKHEKRSEVKFVEADTNGNNALTAEEVTAMLTAWEAKKAARKGKAPREIKPRRVSRYISKLDTDLNSEVEKAEYMAERLAWFDERDENNDGVLSDDERKKR